VQETLLRAWRRLDTFEGRASLRAWLYKIATNACLDALDKRPRRRILPTATYPAADAHAPLEPAVAEPIWLEPYPDDLMAEPEAGPEARYTARESVTLAFLAALQSLPPRQRAVLILRDVLDWRASEVAELLDLTVPAVNSALHRARTTLAKHYHTGGQTTTRAVPVDDTLHALLNRYVQAWESADVAGLVALLKEDATFSMPPVPTWYHGRDTIGAAVGSTIFSGEARGRWHLMPARANTQPAFAVYQRGESGDYRVFGIQVLTFDGNQVSDVTTFVDPALIPRFNLRAELTA
jgi:RNA polymerase sigma-70 factor (ECF subfamily)